MAIQATKKILIIKLGALGDVFRTTTLLHGLKRRFPESRITWITSKAACGLLENNPYINRILVFTGQTINLLKPESFDILISLDKEEKPTMLAMDIKADKKIGFGRDKHGQLYSLNKESEYAYRLGISDELKFRLNKKTYPKIIYEMCSCDYKKDKYILSLSQEDIRMAEERLRGSGIGDRDFVIGLNTGSGNRFANKTWSLDSYKRFIERVVNETDAKVLLLGGQGEKNIIRRLQSSFKDKVYNSGCDNTLKEFAAIVKRCDMMLTGDTLAMHIGIALNRYVMVLFGPTCHQEIELYGKGSKLMSEIECSPCYKKVCDKKDNCMSRISPDRVFKQVKRYIVRDTGTI